MFFSSKKRTIQTHSSNHNLSHQWKKKHLCALCNTAASPRLFTCCYVWWSCLSPTNSEYWWRQEHKKQLRQK